MKRVLASLVVIAMVINSILVYDEYLGGDGGSGWLSDNDGGEGETLDKLSVVVPVHKLNDVVTYDYTVLAEMYWIDYESGNWSLYRLTVDGQLRHWINKATSEKRDGFWNKHYVMQYEMDTDASFELFFDASDADPLYIGGSIQAERDEFRDLTEKRIINTYTEGNVEIDRLPRFNVPLNFDGLVDAYPDPNRPVEKTLEELIWGEGKKIDLDDNGSVVQSKYYEEYDFTLQTFYNWSADKAVMLNGFKTLHINITSVFFGDFLNFNEQYWISSDSSFPIRRFTRTNQSWEDEGGMAYLLLETDNVMVENGYNEGDTDIPWGICKGEHWAQKHPDGEFKQWGYIPLAGDGFSASSFDFRSEDADKFARANSPGLQAFLKEFDKPGNGVTVIYANYNASKNPLDIGAKAGNYRWNLTYGYRPTPDESREARETGDWNFTYNIVVMRNVTKDISKPLGNEYIENVEIEYDWGKKRDYAAMSRQMLPDETLTVAASEDILMKHPLVEDRIADRNGEIDWGDFETSYGLGLAGLGGSGPGFMMVEILTGIAMPSTDYAWALQDNTVYESGNTFSAAVDAKTGQIVYVLEITGTDLISIFA